MTPQLNLALLDADRLATGDAQLFGDQVDSRDHLGDRMLHLDAGVHLHEIESTASVHKEFDGAGALVADAARGGHSGLAHLAAQIGRHRRAGGFFEQLLMPSLDRAVAFAQVHHVAVAVGQHLHLDMAGPVDEFLHVKARVAESRFGFALGRLEQALELVGPRHQAHATPAATRGGLDHHWIPHALGQPRGLAVVGQQAFAAGDRGHPHLLHGGLGRRLVAHGPDGLGGGTHKDQAMVLADLGKAVVLGQKAVARMNRISSAGDRCREDVGNVQVALAAWGLTHAHGFVGQLHMEGIAVDGAVDRHGGNSQFAATAQDSKCDFATVGDQQFADGHPRRAGCSGQGRCGLYQRSPGQPVGILLG